MTCIRNSSGSWLNDKGQMWIPRLDQGSCAWCRSIRAPSVSHVCCVNRDEALPGIVKRMWASSSPSSRIAIKHQNAFFTFRCFLFTAPCSWPGNPPPPSLLLYTQQVSGFSEKIRGTRGKKSRDPCGQTRAPYYPLRPMVKYEIQSVHYPYILCKIEPILLRVLKALRYLC